MPLVYTGPPVEGDNLAKQSEYIRGNAALRVWVCGGKGCLWRFWLAEYILEVDLVLVDNAS